LVALEGNGKSKSVREPSAQENSRSFKERRFAPVLCHG
jgi:hypothetical protein